MYRYLPTDSIITDRRKTEKDRKDRREKPTLQKNLNVEGRSVPCGADLNLCGFKSAFIWWSTSLTWFPGLLICQADRFTACRSFVGPVVSIY